MTLRIQPSWFQASHYDYLTDCNPSQWYLELSTRRQIKALYELRKTEADIFIDNDQPLDATSLYKNFFQQLAIKRSQLQPVSSPIYIHQAPANIQRYIDFKIIPLFDLLHWHELINEKSPTNDELKSWLFPDTDRHVRYIVGDAKKMLKIALLECDAFKLLLLKK